MTDQTTNTTQPIAAKLFKAGCWIESSVLIIGFLMVAHDTHARNSQRIQPSRPVIMNSLRQGPSLSHRMSAVPIHRSNAANHLSTPRRIRPMTPRSHVQPDRFRQAPPRNGSPQHFNFEQYRRGGLSSNNRSRNEVPLITPRLQPGRMPNVASRWNAQIGDMPNVATRSNVRVPAMPNAAAPQPHRPPSVPGNTVAPNSGKVLSREQTDHLKLNQLAALPSSQLRNLSPERAASLERYRSGIAAARRYDAEAKQAYRTVDRMNTTLDAAQMALGAAGMTPGVGVVADLTNAGLSLARGDRTGAALDGMAALPIVGGIAGTRRVSLAASKMAKGDSANPARISFGDDSAIRKANERVKPIPDYYDVIAHGNSRSIGVPGGRTIPPHELARRIKADPAYRNQDICLLSCSTGKLDKGYAYQLAREMNNGRHVVAPSDKLWIHRNGKMTIRSDQGTPGNMRIFYPPQ